MHGDRIVCASGMVWYDKVEVLVVGWLVCSDSMIWIFQGSVEGRKEGNQAEFKYPPPHPHS